jgi:hypothetical protein
MRTIVAFLLASTTEPAAPPQAHRDIAYGQPKDERRTLD